MTAVYLSSDGHSQQDRAPYHKAKIRLVLEEISVNKSAETVSSALLRIGHEEWGSSENKR